MNINIYNQLYNLFVFIITGIVIGILFDIFRIIRRSFKTPDIITYIEDIFFWIITGGILLFSIFTFNNGEIRSYVFIGLILGSSIYLLTLSKYFIKISVFVLTTVKKIIYFPIKKIYFLLNKFIFKPFSTLSAKIKNNIIKFTNKTNKNIKKENLPNFYEEN